MSEFAKYLKESLDDVLNFAYICKMSHDHIIILIEMLAAARHRSPHTIGRLASGSGDFYARLAAGHDLTVRRASRVTRYLSNHWPDGVDWPAGIPRPPSEGHPLRSDQPTVDAHRRRPAPGPVGAPDRKDRRSAELGLHRTRCPR